MDWKVILPLLSLFIYETTTALTEGPMMNASCGCTTETLPHPRIVLLGPTGVGKSTFGNRLLGITEYNEKEAVCSEFGEDTPYKFGVGHRSESHTVQTSWLVGHYLGDPSNPCITIIDTPGTGDTEGRDCEHGIALAEGLKEIGSIDAFLLLFKGTNPRFSQSMQEQLQLYTNIFGTDLFKNAISEFTYWSHDKRSVINRARTRDGLNEEVQHQTWNKEYANKLAVPRKINTVFIDPVYDEEIADERENEMYKKYTNKLWELITTEFTEFKCDKRCKAPSGFFSGQPWLFEENIIQNKRPEDRSSITWNIWFAGCDGTGTKSYRIYFKAETEPERVIYEYIIDKDDKDSIDDSNLLKHMTITDEPAEKFKKIRLTISFIDDIHFGEYYLENDKGRSNISKLNKIIDGEWADWGTFGNCSKTCVKANEMPGNMERVRECKPPKNGGLVCKGEDKQNKTCAHRPGGNTDIFRRCPVDAIWSEWASDWGKCSSNCIKEGETVPTQSRSRVCYPERDGGKTCLMLEVESKERNKPLHEETRDCSSLLKCPKPASLEPWSEWSHCSVTCYPEGGAIPQRTRIRKCKKASLSSSNKLNADILTCKVLGEMTEHMNCEIPACPVYAEWQGWGDWSSCSTSCGLGSKGRSRGYNAGRNGAAAKPVGLENQKAACNAEKKCPVKATWSWGTWSPCDIDCYRPDGWRGKRSRKQLCVEGDPPHEIFNCQYPPAPGLMDYQFTCPGISQCSSLTRIYARIHAETNCGTDASVYLKLKNGDAPEEKSENCETEVLDSRGNSWQRAGTEDFRGGDELKPCKNFYPSSENSLMFNFKLSSSDGLNMKELYLEFGDKHYSWTGGAWFNSDLHNWIKLDKLF